MDGLKVKNEEAPDDIDLSQYYNGEKSDVSCTLFLFFSNWCNSFSILHYTRKYTQRHGVGWGWAIENLNVSITKLV